MTVSDRSNPAGPPRGPAGPGSTPGRDGDDRIPALIELVTAHRAADEREELSRAIILSELDRLDHPFDEDADLSHVTASAIVVGPRGVVLHRHRRLHRWMQPGGHVESGESPSEAALRECVEETGLPVAHPADGPTLVHVDVHTAARDHVHLDLRYLVLAADVTPSPAPGESPEVAWFTWEDALDIADAPLSEGLRSARRLIGASAGRDDVPLPHRGEDR